MKVERSVMSETVARPGGNLVQRLCRRSRLPPCVSAYPGGHAGRNVETGQDQPLSISGIRIAHMRIGIDMVHPHPQLAPCPLTLAKLTQIGDMRPHLATLPGDRSCLRSSP